MISNFKPHFVFAIFFVCLSSTDVSALSGIGKPEKKALNSIEQEVFDARDLESHEIDDKAQEVLSKLQKSLKSFQTLIKKNEVVGPVLKQDLQTNIKNAQSAAKSAFQALALGDGMAAHSYLLELKDAVDMITEIFSLPENTYCRVAVEFRVYTEGGKAYPRSELFAQCDGVFTRIEVATGGFDIGSIQSGPPTKGKPDIYKNGSGNCENNISSGACNFFDSKPGYIGGIGMGLYDKGMEENGPGVILGVTIKNKKKTLANRFVETKTPGLSIF
jgi:hypothetical protein